MFALPQAHMTDVERVKTSALEMMALLYRARTGAGLMLLLAQRSPDIREAASRNRDARLCRPGPRQWSGRAFQKNLPASLCVWFHHVPRLIWNAKLPRRLA